MLTSTMRRAAGATVACVLLSVGLTALGAEPAAIPRDDRGLPQWQIRQWDDTPVRIVVEGPAAMGDLLARVPLRDFSRENFRPGAEGWLLDVRVTSTEAQDLMAAGVVYTRLPDAERVGRQAVERAWAAPNRVAGPMHAAAKSDAPAITYYPTHAEIGTLLANLATDHASLCRTFSWGQSVQGRELWGLVVSADVNNTTAEPEVRLSSSMHGDEVVGMILLLNLAYHLVQNHDQPGYEALTELVDSTEIHIMPLHNPDGYVAGTRNNANGVNLNRNFPEPAGTQSVREIENLNFMAHANAHHFVISENGHGGALVVNYPWDYTLTRAPDDAALIKLSLEYATHNLPMYNGPFDQGITNGADWYVVYGSVQDWAYDQTGCIDLTIEHSSVKWPSASTLPGFWDDNRESFLHVLAAAHFGVNGVVSDSLSGDPVAATVTVTGNTMSVTTDPAHGDYYKLLDSGTYELTFVAEGYRPKTIAGVSTTWGTPTVLDVQLAPTASPVPRVDQRRTAVAVWPNPFNPGTRVTLTVPVAGAVSLGVYDLQGRLVRSLLAGQYEAGDHPVAWDGRTDSGNAVPSGVYFARALTDAGPATAKLLLVK